MIHTASRMESLCEVAFRYGFSNCNRLRGHANSHMTNRVRLNAGDQVFVPTREERLENGATEARHRFQMDRNRAPRIEFIRELGRGYGEGVSPLSQEERDARGGDFLPERDPVIRALNVSNYVCDRGGDNATAGDFPAPDAYGFDRLGSDDPDHFKVQIQAPNIPQSVTEVKATLYALKPHYFKQRINNKDFVEHAGRYYKRLPQANRKLEVTCKRIGKTKYFRSPYLRVVTSEEDRNQRIRQSLMILDLFNEGANASERHHTQILHHRVEAEALLAACAKTDPHPRCGVYNIARLVTGDTLHIALHGIDDGSHTVDDLREAAYRWTRRVLAQMQIRPVLEVAELRPAPTNILSIANASATTAGRHASGRNASGGRSQFRFTVDAVNVTVPLNRDDSPTLTAVRVALAITSTAGLEDYEATVHAAPRANFTANATRSVPVDVIVMKPAPADGSPREPADVRGARSTDVRHNNRGPQTVQSINSHLNATIDFVVSANENGTMAQRAMLRSYHTPNCINAYIVGSNRIILSPPDGNSYDGWSPFGNFGGFQTAVGPSAFIRGVPGGGVGGITRPLILIHEIGHPLFHAGHVRVPPTPLKDAPPAPAAGTARTIEFMDPQVLDDVDAHDMCKHCADTPIRTAYELVEHWPTVPVLDGSAPANTTPVQRFQTVARFYNALRVNGRVPLHGDSAAGLPATAPQVPRRRPPGITPHSPAGSAPPPQTGVGIDD
jgi:translation initiation factor IF-1